MSYQTSNIDNEAYYKILGVPKEATIAEIKKQYRELSMKYHPDKNGGDEAASEKFKEINEAYSVLSDKDKREIYDEMGVDGLNGSRHQHQHRPNLQPLIVEVECNLGELYKGVHKSVKFIRVILEGDPRNPRTLQKTPMEDTFEFDLPPCTIFGQQIVMEGLGHKHKTDPDLIGPLVIVIVPPPDQVDENKENKMPMGFPQMRTPPKGEYLGFKLEGIDLHYNMHISLSEALIGFKRKFTFVDDDQKIEISRVDGITKPDTIKLITGLGFKRTINTPRGPLQKVGDLHIHFIVDFPDKPLNDKQMKSIISALGVPAIDKSLTPPAKLKTFVFKDLANPKPEGMNGMTGSRIFMGGMPGMGMGMGMGGMPDMGDEEEMGGGSAPECRQM